MCVCVLECDFQSEEGYHSLMLFLFLVFTLNFGFKCDVAGGRETLFNPVRLSLLSTIYEEGETLQKDFRKAFAFSSSALEAPEKDLLQGGELTKVFNIILFFVYNHGFKLQTHCDLCYCRESLSNVALCYQNHSGRDIKNLMSQSQTLFLEE